MPSRIIPRRRPSSSHSSQSKSPITITRNQPITKIAATSSDSAFFSDGTNSNSLSSTVPTNQSTKPISQTDHSQVKNQSIDYK